MNKEIAIELNAQVKIIADRYSNANREMNFNKELFTVDKVIPTSDHTAVVVFKKTSGKNVYLNSMKLFKNLLDTTKSQTLTTEFKYVNGNTMKVNANNVLDQYFTKKEVAAELYKKSHDIISNYEEDITKFQQVEETNLYLCLNTASLMKEEVLKQKEEMRKMKNHNQMK